MIKDIYSRDALAPKYNDATLEVSDTLSQLILKIENCLFTNKGDVLGAPGIGCNLDELIFSLVLNENTIQNNINSQITAYCLPDIAGRPGNWSAKSVNTSLKVPMRISILISGKRQRCVTMCDSYRTPTGFLLRGRNNLRPKLFRLTIRSSIDSRIRRDNIASKVSAGKPCCVDSASILIRLKRT